MSLSLDSRHCGRVFVIKCVGRIVTGEEAAILEACMNRGLLESTRIVVQTSDVTRVDSTGMGLLVRFLSHTRNRGGDLRLAAPAQLLSNLLQLTKLATIFRIYDSEDEAIVSFLKEPAIPSAAGDRTGPSVLFVDQSPDLCAFVRTLLQRHGYQVLSTCRMHDAKTLLSAGKVDYIVLGPDSSSLPADSAAASLKSLAPKAATVLLQKDFKHGDAEHAGLELLRLMQHRGNS
jgi:anti-sigma B factor antagonist